MADWVPNLTWVLVYVLYYAQYRKAPRARMRVGDHGHPLVCARRALCVVSGRKAARMV